MEKPDEVEPAWRQALAADRPFVIDFRTDPAVPPIPPHATLDQIEAAAASVLKGDSDRAGMIRQGLKAKVQEMLPGTRHRHPDGDDVTPSAPAGEAPSVDAIEAAAYTLATDAPEGDGTLAWDKTTLVVVHARSGSHHRVRLHLWGAGDRGVHPRPSGVRGHRPPRLGRAGA